MVGLPVCHTVGSRRVGGEFADSRLVEELEF